MGQKTFQPKHRKTSAGRTFNGRRAIENMYDHAWRKYCDKFLEINFECYACAKRATVVDHLRPHKGDDKLFKKLDNHIPLCVSCHNTVTMLFDAKYRPGNPISDKIQWLNRKRVPGDGGNPRRVKVMHSYG